MLRQIDLFAALAKCRDQLGAAFLHLRIGGVPGRLTHEGEARAQRRLGARRLQQPRRRHRARRRIVRVVAAEALGQERRSEEHTSELQSLMRTSYAVFCLKKTKKK